MPTPSHPPAQREGVAHKSRATRQAEWIAPWM